MASSASKFSAARPKRAADHDTRIHHESDAHSSKKPRFDPRNPSTLAADNDDEEDPVLEADVIGKGAGLKRNAINIDGYDSDSSTENFDVRADARMQKDTATNDEDDDDMFAEDTKDDEQDDILDKKKKKKHLRFLEDHEIEGQEGASKSGGHVAVDFTAGKINQTDDVETSSESGDDEERDRIDSDMDEELGAGGKKKHAPRLDAFNMKAEQEEGRFDEYGNYIRKAYDPEAELDSWLEGLSKKDIKKAKAAHDKREAERREREKADDNIVIAEALALMIRSLEKGETPLEALVRYNKRVPPKKTTNNWSKKKKEQQKQMDVQPDPAQEAVAAKAKKAIEDVAECLSQLEKRGVDDPNNKPREFFMRRFKDETGDDWKDPPPPEAKWEFHWLTAPEGDIHGPYDEVMMRAWAYHGHFAPGAEFRKVGETEWSQSPEFGGD